MIYLTLLFKSSKATTVNIVFSFKIQVYELQIKALTCSVNALKFRACDYTLCVWNKLVHLSSAEWCEA